MKKTISYKLSYVYLALFADRLLPVFYFISIKIITTVINSNVACVNGRLMSIIQLTQQDFTKITNGQLDATYMAYWSPLEVATTVDKRDEGYLRPVPVPAATAAAAAALGSAMYVGWMKPPAVSAAPCNAATEQQWTIHSTTDRMLIDLARCRIVYWRTVRT